MAHPQQRGERSRTPEAVGAGAARMDPEHPGTLDGAQDQSGDVGVDERGGLLGHCAGDLRAAVRRLDPGLGHLHGGTRRGRGGPALPATVDRLRGLDAFGSEGEQLPAVERPGRHPGATGVGGVGGRHHDVDQRHPARLRPRIGAVHGRLVVDPFGRGGRRTPARHMPQEMPRRVGAPVAAGRDPRLLPPEDDREVGPADGTTERDGQAGAGNDADRGRQGLLPPGLAPCQALDARGGGPRNPRVGAPRQPAHAGAGQPGHGGRDGAARTPDGLGVRDPVRNGGRSTLEGARGRLVVLHGDTLRQPTG